MMQIFASDLLSTLHSLPSTAVSDPKNQEIGIDIAVTTLPYFVDKSKAIQENDAYPEQMQQVHLTGFDTLIRIMDPKYYPPGDGLNSVAEFLGKHRLRVTYRTDDKWGSREKQDVYLRDLGTLGEMEDGGTKREWVSEGRIVLVEGRKEGEELVSSTKAREAVRKGNIEELKRLVTGGVTEWIVGERLYLDD
jgi:nicotinamide-nucleotide adenylyltransferase